MATLAAAYWRSAQYTGGIVNARATPTITGLESVASDAGDGRDGAATPAS
ncbi:MAG: hypothetical protein U0694_07365 [Anaerolineae bacterium]